MRESGSGGQASAGSGGALQLDCPENVPRKSEYSSLKRQAMAATASCTGLTPCYGPSSDWDNILAIAVISCATVQMNTPTSRKERVVARVAIDVRLYFDVPISSEKPEDIRQSAREELERVADGEQIRIKRLHFPELYPSDDWPAIELDNFHICQVCPASEANSETRFPL